MSSVKKVKTTNSSKTKNLCLLAVGGTLGLACFMGAGFGIAALIWKHNENVPAIEFFDDDPYWWDLKAFDSFYTWEYATTKSGIDPITKNRSSSTIQYNIAGTRIRPDYKFSYLKSAGGFATIGNELLNFMKPSQSIPNYPEEETDTISYGYYLEKFSYIYDETSKIYSDGTLVETNSNPYCVFQYLTSELYIDNDTGWMDDGTVYVDRHIQKLIVSPSFICDDRFSIETLKIAHIDERINENSPENKIEYSYEIETKLSENIENSNDFDIRLSGKAGQLFNSVAGWSNVSASVVDGSNNQVAQLNGTYWATNDERVLEFSTTSDLLSQHEYFIKISFSANDISPLPVTQ